MGARTLIRFVRGAGGATVVDKVVPMIYLHWGGPPQIMAETFDEFFARIERDAGKDTRYNDPEYLAARFVVFASVECGSAEDPGTLGFTGVGVTATTVVKAIEGGSFTYAVDCSDNGPRLRPKILVDEVLFTDTHEIAHHSVCTIEDFLDAQRKNEEEDNAKLV